MGSYRIDSWILLLSLVYFKKLIYVIVFSGNSFFFYCCLILHCMAISKFVHPFYLWPLWLGGRGYYKAAMSILGFFVDRCFYFSWSGIAGSYGRFICVTLWEAVEHFLYNACAILLFYHLWIWVLSVPYHCQWEHASLNGWTVLFHIMCLDQWDVSGSF